MISSICCNYRNNCYSVLCCIFIPAAPSSVQCSIMLPDWLILSKYLFFPVVWWRIGNTVLGWWRHTCRRSPKDTLSVSGNCFFLHIIYITSSKNLRSYCSQLTIWFPCLVVWMEMCGSLTHGRQNQSTSCRQWKDWRLWTSIHRQTCSLGERCTCTFYMIHTFSSIVQNIAV